MKEIKKEVLINAPVAKVWQHLTDSKKLESWLMVNDFKPRIGRKFIFRCEVSDDDEWDGIVYCELKEITPMKRLVFSWTSDQIKDQTLVTITLEQVEDKTRVTLIHSGWDKLPPDKDFLFDNYDSGWGSYIEQKLKAAVEQQ